MNLLDITVAIIVVIAAIAGWRSGVTRQLFSLGGIIVGIIIANKFGHQVGAMIGITGELTSTLGFIIVFIAALITTSLLGLVVKKLFHFVGLGVVDNLLGVALSSAKYLVIISIIFALLTPLNSTVEFIPRATLEGSFCYSKMMEISALCTPSLEWIEAETKNLYQDV